LPPWSALGLSSRRALLQRLQTDPLARELSRTLAVAAGAALVLAAAAVLLAALVAVRDEGAELYELEATGADPALLRASVRLRAALLAGLGMLAGVLIGLALLALLVDSVQVTAAGRDAFPPLVPVVPWGTWTVGAIAFALGCAAIVAVGTARLLSGSVPRRLPAVAP
jgi:ABC-type antimicrobial peptide transport system permease subunit